MGSCGCGIKKKIEVTAQVEEEKKVDQPEVVLLRKDSSISVVSFNHLKIKSTLIHSGSFSALTHQKT